MKFYVEYENNDQKVFVSMVEGVIESAQEITEEEANEIRISCPYSKLHGYERDSVLNIWRDKYASIKEGIWQYATTNVIGGQVPAFPTFTATRGGINFASTNVDEIQIEWYPDDEDVILDEPSPFE